MSEVKPIEVTLGEIEAGAESLKKLAANAKLSPPLFIRFANAWRDVREQLDVYRDSHTALVDANSEFMIGHAPNGDEVQYQKYPNMDAKRRYEDGLKQLRQQVVTLPRSKPIAWKAIEDARNEKTTIDITPHDVACLAWLIELPEDA